MWVVLFSPGLGGNHLLNVINTDPAMGVDRNYTMSRYSDGVEDAFAMGGDKNHFHHSTGSNHNPNFLEPKHKAKAFYDRCGAISMHLWQYATLYTTDNIIPDDHKHIIIEIPTEKDGLAYDRWIAYNIKQITPRQDGQDALTPIDTGLANGEKEYYHHDIIRRIVPNLDPFYIPAELVFTQYGDRLFEWFIDNTDIKPDPECVRLMQRKFYQEQLEFTKNKFKHFRENSIEWRNSNND